MSDADDKSTPFARRPVVWGRPPQTTFRAGPLPRGTGLMPPVPTPQAQAPKPAPRPAVAAPAAPRPASGGGVFSGSLVPQRRPAPPAAPTLITAPMPTAPQPQPQQPPRAAAPVAPAAPVDMTPRPLPQAAVPAHEPRPRPAASEPEPAPASRPILAAAPEVEPAPSRPPVAPRAPTRKVASRTPLYIAVAAVVVIGAPLATWLITRSNNEPAPASPPVPAAAPASHEVIAAPAPARVAYAGPLKEWGEVVILDLGPGWRVVVAGLDQLSVETGQRVGDGQALGRTGEDGEAYFELRRDERPIDPAPWLQ